MDEQIMSIPCVILAGGLGTRLRTEVKDVAKPMAPMGHKPFLHVLMDQLHIQGVENFVLAVGFKAESIQNYFEKLRLPYSITYSYEEELLGTGGALKQAAQNITSERFLAINGDTFFDLNILDFLNDSDKSSAPFFMALMQSSEPERFGGVQVENGKVISFGSLNKASNYRNAGVYCIRTELLKGWHEQQFSLEQDFLPKIAHQALLDAACYSAYFIDIGVPKDLKNAQNKFAKFYIDFSWTLFLDRDGVINERLVGDYVKNPEDFHFKSGVLEAVAAFSKIFGRIIVVTNQQGIGKNIMTERNLSDIHRYMISEIQKHGGRIDAVYFAPQLAQENSEMRKPNSGMALQAKRDFGEIDFAKSVMIGDSDSDIVFGQNLGMITVKLANVDVAKVQATVHRENLIDCKSLFEKL